MSENWKTYKIEDIASKISIGPFGSRMKSDCYVDEGIPVIRGKNLGERPDFISDFVYITEKKADELLGCNVFKGDLVFPHRGAIGEVGLVTKDERFVLSSSLMKLTCDNAKADSRFVYYFFKSDIGKRRLLLNESQVGTPGIGQPLSSLRDIDISLPELPEQRAIASILSAIDDKIELNLQMNKTLEEMAMTLYKHWFVDFGPFQDGEFVDSELGMIPKGWEVKGILEIAQLLSGGTPKTTVSEYWDGDIHWVSAKDIGNGGNIYINETEKTITGVGVKNSSTKILPEDTVILVARGSVGKYGMIAKSMAMNQSCYGLYTKSEFSQGLVYLMVSMLISQFQRVAYGSVFDTITTSTFETTKVISPPSEIVHKLKNLIDPLFLELKQNTIENQSLTTFRDTLLTKLISGEVRVKDTEKALAEGL